MLAWLYPPDRSSRWVAIDELALVAPDLTSGGLQSTINYLESKKSLVTERLEGQLSVSITTHGMRALEEQLPAFSAKKRQWKGNWQGVFFLEAPAGDNNFRFLRRLLTNVAAVPVSRGMYLYPGELPEKVIFELNSSYVGSVMVVEFAQWVFGDEKEIIGSTLQLGDLVDAYSSISKEIDTLLTVDQTLISFTDQQKLRFSSIYDRLFGALQHDLGVQRAYFPQVENGVDLLFRLQTLSSMG
mgnify:CR=1 FL=1